MPANRQRANSGEDGRVVSMQARIYGECDAGGDGSKMIEGLSLDIFFWTGYDPLLGQRDVADELQRNNFRLLTRLIRMNKVGEAGRGQWW